MPKKPNTHGKLALRPKSYLIDVHNFGKRGVEEYNYHNFGEAKRHLRHLLLLVSSQAPGRSIDGRLTPKIVCSEVLRSKRQDKETPPARRFVEASGVAPVAASTDASYIIWVDYKTFWPLGGESEEWHYHSLEEAEKHLRFLFAQVAGQNGKNGVRKNVIRGFALAFCKKAKRTKIGTLPVSRFMRPKGRKIPDGGTPVPFFL